MVDIRLMFGVCVLCVGKFRLGSGRWPWYDNGGFVEYIVASENKVIPPYDATLSLMKSQHWLSHYSVMAWCQSKIEECKSPQALILGGGRLDCIALYLH